MTDGRPVVLILGSGPNVTAAREWPKTWFDQIVVINNAWRVRPDWDVLVFPEDFSVENQPPKTSETQSLVQASAFVPAQNKFGGFVFAGATMAFTAAYWALDTYQPKALAFMGCDMVYPKEGDTHFYGTGTPDPLRQDVSLRDLGAKSARLAAIAGAQGCACLNLSVDPSALLFARAAPEAVGENQCLAGQDRATLAVLRAQEDALGYGTPNGRYDVAGDSFDIAALDDLDARWRALFAGQL